MSALYRVRTAITAFQGGAELNTLYFNAAVGTEQQAATAVHDFWDSIKAMSHSLTRFQVEPIVYTIDSATGLATSTAGVSTAQVSATDNGDPMPGMVNGVVRFHTGLFIAGRELTGKMWIPQPTEARNTSGAPDSTYTSTIDAALPALEGSATHQLVIWSRKHFQFFDVSSGSVWQQWGSLRSRRS